MEGYFLGTRRVQRSCQMKLWRSGGLGCIKSIYLKRSFCSQSLITDLKKFYTMCVCHMPDSSCRGAIRLAWREAGQFLPRPEGRLLICRMVWMSSLAEDCCVCWELCQGYAQETCLSSSKVIPAIKFQRITPERLTLTKRKL